MVRTLRLLWLVSFTAVLSACASYPVNEKLGAVDVSSGYRLNNLELGARNSDDVFVVLALSGGGTRAAALDFGVISELDKVRFGDDDRSLLDEVDIVSSSSGASLASGYYGLFGKESFLEDFSEDVLYQNIQSSLARRVINPLNWPRLMSGTFSRGDLFAEYLDETIFLGKTFADMRPQRPLILLNATDIGVGSTFSFAQPMFDLLCSDISSYKVARAVTASMAFTPGFTPITLKNYNDGSCGDEGIAWALDAQEQGVEANPQLYAMATDYLSYRNIERRPYIHLLDSGIADNIGVRVPLTAFQVQESPSNLVGRVRDGSISKLVFIIVNARPKSDFKPDLSPKPPGAITSVQASASRPLANYSFETVNLVRKDIDDARDRIYGVHQQRERCVDHAETFCTSNPGVEDCRAQVRDNCFEQFGVDGPVPPVDLDIYLIHLSFDLIDDPQRRKRFETIPTKLQLPKQDVDDLVGLAPELLLEEPEFALLVEDLGAHYSQ